MEQSLKDFIGKYKERIDLGIAEELEKRLTEVKDISPYLVPVLEAMLELSVGGKRLRAILTILGYEMSGKRVDREVIKAAVVMEIFHLGLLIQDDVMDRDSKRRGVVTIHTRHDDVHLGESLATLAGDLPLGWGMENLAKLNLPKETVAKAIEVWGKYTGRVIYGQMLDVSKVADEATLLSILNLKSGEYTCVLPLLLGVTLGGGSEELKETLTKYGMELGWVFQLRDDWLAEHGESEKTGKSVGNDSREGKHTFATMNGREKTEEAIAEHMKNGIEKAMGNEILEGLIEWVGTRDN